MEIEPKRAQADAELTEALRMLIPEVLRNMAGGSGSMPFHQAIYGLAEAFEKYASIVGFAPPQYLIHSAFSLFNLRNDRAVRLGREQASYPNDEQAAMDEIVHGSMRLLAGWLDDQMTQVSKAESKISQGIRDLRAARGLAR